MVDDTQEEQRWKDFKQAVRKAWQKVSETEIDEYKDSFEGVVDYVEEATGKARRSVRKKVKKLARKTGFDFE